MSKSGTESNADLTLTDADVPDLQEEGSDRTRIATRPRPAVALPPCIGRVRIQQTPDTRAVGTTFELRGTDVFIGRLPENTIPLNDPEVSGRHAKIVRFDGDNILLDLESTNGTLVNGELIQKHRLRRNDVIKIGATVFQYDPA